MEKTKTALEYLDIGRGTAQRHGVARTDLIGTALVAIVCVLVDILFKINLIRE